MYVEIFTVVNFRKLVCTCEIKCAMYISMQLRLQKFVWQTFSGFHGISVQKFQRICMYLELWYRPGLAPKPGHAPKPGCAPKPGLIPKPDAYYLLVLMLWSVFSRW